MARWRVHILARTDAALSDAAANRPRERGSQENLEGAALVERVRNNP